MLLGNQALTLLPFCFSLKCLIWGWGFRVREEKEQHSRRPIWYCRVLITPSLNSLACALSRKQQPLPLPTAHGPVSHPTPSTPSSCLSHPGNLQMQTRVGMSAPVHKEDCFSNCGEVQPELVKVLGLLVRCWRRWRGHPIVMENWGGESGCILLLGALGKNSQTQPVCKGSCLFTF